MRNMKYIFSLMIMVVISLTIIIIMKISTPAFAHATHTTMTIKFGEHHYYNLPIIDALKFQTQIETRMAEINAEKIARQKEFPNNEAYNLGNFIGESLKAASIETGIPIDVLASSPSISNMITYKYVAKNFTMQIIGGFWFLTLVPTWCYFFYRMAIIKTVVNSDGKRRNINYDPNDVIGVRWFMFFALIVLTIIGLIIIF